MVGVLEMRDIKFRVWDVKRKDMIDDVSVSSNYVEFDQEQYGTYEEFIPMQYTGLKDSKNREVYEGDILKGSAWPYDEVFAVQWQEESMGFVFAKNGWMYNHFIEEMGRDMSIFEVIGNIYENRDLLTYE